MPRLLLISTSYPQKNDGSEAAGSFVQDFAIALSRHIEVTVLAPALTPGIDDVSDTLRVVYFQVPRLPLSLLKAYNPLDWYAIARTINAGTTAVQQVISESSIDHILAMWALPSGYWASQAKRVPYSTWALGSDIWTLGKIPFINNVLRKVLQLSHCNFADGYQLADQVEALSSRPCYFLPSTRSLELNKPKELATSPPYKLAFLGRWHPNKGIDLLLESLTALTDEDWQLIAEIRIAGGGPLSDQVHDAAAQLQAKGYPVRLFGFLDKVGATELFAWADYIIIPSRIESIPVIFSDAMKCRCPVVSTPVGDMPRLMSEYAVGELSDEVSSPALTQALRRMLKRAPVQFENGLQQSAAQFSVDHSVATLLNRINVTHDERGAFDE